MAYDDALGSSKDRARLILGDTGADSMPELNTDATIAAMFLLHDNNFNLAVAELADGLATRFAQQPDWYDDEGGVRTRWNDRVKAWQMLANRLRSQVVEGDVSAPGVIYADGQVTMPCATRSPHGHEPGLRW